MKRTHSKDSDTSKLVKTSGVNDPIEVDDETKSYNASYPKKAVDSAYSYGTFVSPSMKPTAAFKWHGIEFWGSSRFNLDEIVLTDKDFIINCSGILFINKPFVLKQPSWLDLGIGEKPIDQLLLEWKDFGAPPEFVDLNFWKKILDKAIEHGVKRIFCCCGAGQGRTGTALAALLLATEATKDPEIAINYVRDNYSDKAIENKTQELYLWNLLYTEEELFGKDPVIEASLIKEKETEETGFDEDGWIIGSGYGN